MADDTIVRVFGGNVSLLISKVKYSRNNKGVRGSVRSVTIKTPSISVQ